MQPKRFIEFQFRIPVIDWKGEAGGWRAWLPSRGNLLFTIVLVSLLTWVQSGLAVEGRLEALQASSIRTIPYQGRLADVDGLPLTGTYNMIFRLYDVATGGLPLWEEQWIGPNSVRVSDGLFSVMLGSLSAIPANVVSDYTELWLGVTVGTDSEMLPRVQLGSVPFAMQALTVPDESITSAKIKDGAIQAVDIAADAIPPGVPVGTVISWWRATANTPLPSDEWMVADGSVVADVQSPFYNQSLPNLTNSFIMGVSPDQLGVSGGSNSLNLTHAHTIAAHTHTVQGNTGEVRDFWDGGYYKSAGDGRRMAVNTYQSTWYYRHNHELNLTSSAWSGSTDSFALTADNRPQYYGLVYLIRIK